MIGIIHYDMGNVTSVKNACTYVGAEAKILHDPTELKGVSHVILPGVGAFGMGMERLKQSGFADALRDVVAERKPLLGICLGMQLFASVGEEGGVNEGFGFIPGRVVRFSITDLRIPHVGWNNLTIKKENPILTGEQGLDFYFVHSYHLVLDDSTHEVASCDYGIPFTAVVQKGCIFGTQFHPEKSFRAGLDLLERFSCLC